MKWITREEVKEASKDKMTALKCSLKHHEQGRDAGSLELQTAIKDELFDMTTGFCACCERFDVANGCRTTNGICPLSVSEGSLCCDGVFMEAKTPYRHFYGNPSNENLKKFQDAEAEVCKYIEGVIEKLLAEEKKQKPLLRAGDVAISNMGRACIVIGNGKDAVNHFEDGHTCPQGEITGGTYTKDGRGKQFNIFDEAKALQENVTEFILTPNGCNEGEGFLVCANGAADIDIGIACDSGNETWCANLEELEEYSMQIRKVIATLKRKEAKK
jgi:hypothetical protein